MKRTMCKLRVKSLLAAILAGYAGVSGAVYAADETLQPEQIVNIDKKDSSYTLTRVDAPGPNTITKYEYNKTTGQMTPVYYRVDLNKTTYGKGDSEKSFNVNFIDGGTVEINNKYQSAYGKGEETKNFDVTMPGGVVNVDAKYSTDNHLERVVVPEGTDYGDITGNFIENYEQITTNHSVANDSGAAIYNERGTIGDITGDFIGNYAQATSEYGSAHASGAAIYSAYGNIGIIVGDFVGNYAKATSEDDYAAGAFGGAIYNYDLFGVTAKIDDINGDFIGNYAQATSANSVANAFGGAIYNNCGTVGNIIGDFIGNFVKSNGLYGTLASGGAVYNIGTIKSLRSDFIGNYVHSSSHAYGGAVYNEDALIGQIIGDFTGNNAQGSNLAYGGAIANVGCYANALISVDDCSILAADFIGNYAVATSEHGMAAAQGGAIYNIAGKKIGVNEPVIAEIGNISGDFIGNYVQATDNDDSLATYVDYTGTYAQGGAIYNSGYRGTAKIGNIAGNFVGNYAQATSEHTSVEVSGGAIYNNRGTVGNIIGDFTGNFVKSNGLYSTLALGGAIYNYYNSTIGNITGDFIGNYAQAANESGIAEAYGGAIYNSGIVGEIVNSMFIGNYAKVSEGGTALGGAIYTEESLNFVADNGITGFSGNYVQVGDKKDAQAIYAKITQPRYSTVESKNIYFAPINSNNAVSIGQLRQDYIDNNSNSSNSVINFTAKNNGVIVLNDKIASNIFIFNNPYIFNYSDRTKRYLKPSKDNAVTDYYYQEWNDETHTYDKYYLEAIEDGQLTEPATGDNVALDINFQGDSTGLILLNNDIEGYTEDGERGAMDVNLYVVTLHLANRDNVLDHNNLTLNSGTFNMINNQTGVSALNSLTVNGDTNFLADVDLANERMDRFTANEYGEHKGNLNVVGMNLLSDTTADTVDIYFAEKGLKDNVTVQGDAKNTLDLPQSGYQTVAYTPIYKYNVRYDNRDDAGYFVFARGGGKNASDGFNPAVLAGPVVTQAAAQSTMNETFRYVFEHADGFTQMPEMVRTSKIIANRYAMSTDFNHNLGSLCRNHEDNRAVWVRPYSTFESIDLSNGPKVDTITYGTLVGFDSNFRELKRGWTNVFTGYLGYNGASINYNGVDANTNGGLIGLTETFYKGNFWTALTASAGAGVAESHTMYGKEDSTYLMAGLGSKTGYNLEFKEGRFIIQPIMFLSYTFVNTFDYTNAAGVRIESDPMHTVQINPSVRFIGNLKSGWQPYASVGMVWNLFNQTSATANGIDLPRMHTKPYVEYGIGLQRNWKDRFTGFGQAMIRNGGRNGIALTFGFRWAFGHDSHDEKVHAPEHKISAVKTVIKQ